MFFGNNQLEEQLLRELKELDGVREIRVSEDQKYANLVS